MPHDSFFENVLSKYERNWSLCNDKPIADDVNAKSLIVMGLGLGLGEGELKFVAELNACARLRPLRVGGGGGGGVGVRMLWVEGERDKRDERGDRAACGINWYDC